MHLSDAFDDWRDGIVLRDSFAELLGVAVTFSNKDVSGAAEVRWRLAEGAEDLRQTVGELHVKSLVLGQA